LNASTPRFTPSDDVAVAEDDIVELTRNGFNAALEGTTPGTVEFSCGGFDPVRSGTRATKTLVLFPRRKGTLDKYL
jgi:hypothetical protein